MIRFGEDGLRKSYPFVIFSELNNLWMTVLNVNIATAFMQSPVLI